MDNGYNEDLDYDTILYLYIIYLLQLVYISTYLSIPKYIFKTI